jgi:hypothetical protein
MSIDDRFDELAGSLGGFYRQGTRRWDHAGYRALYASAGLPAPTLIDLPSGATLFLVDGSA